MGASGAGFCANAGPVGRAAATDTKLTVAKKILYNRIRCLLCTSLTAT
jgi:hypothetical protein